MTQPTQNSAPSLLDSTPIHDKHNMLSALDGDEQQNQLKHPGRTNLLRFVVGGVIVSVLAVTVMINSWTAPEPKIVLDAPLKTVTTTEAQLTSETKALKTGASLAENSAPSTVETLPASLPTNAQTPEVPPTQAATIITELGSPSPQKADSPQIATGNNAHERLNAALSGSPVPDTDTAPDKIADKSAEPKTTHKGSAPAVSKRVVAGKAGDDRDVKVLSALVASSDKTDHKKPDQSDSDIQVISALVASAKPAASKPKNSGQQSTSQAKSSVKNTENDNKDQSHNLNVAEHSAEESISSQIEQCKALGIVDDMVCRWRACSGHWRNDPICQGVSQ